jgi:transposase-like protein
MNGLKKRGSFGPPSRRDCTGRQDRVERRPTLNPQTQFCHNPACRARGLMGQGNIVVHSHGEQRYRCQTCGHTFAATTGTPFDRVHTAADVVTIVLPWLGHGCPIPAIVAALGLDERTVAAWMPRAGRHGQQVHQHVVLQGQVDLQHVQADALWMKLVGRRVWMAIGPGGAVAAVARGGHQFPAGRAADHHAGAACPGLWPQPGDPGLCGWLGQLCHGCAARVP